MAVVRYNINRSVFSFVFRTLLGVFAIFCSAHINLCIRFHYFAAECILLLLLFYEAQESQRDRWRWMPRNKENKVILSHQSKSVSIHTHELACDTRCDTGGWHSLFGAHTNGNSIYETNFTLIKKSRISLSLLLIHLFRYYCDYCYSFARALRSHLTPLTRQILAKCIRALLFFVERMAFVCILFSLFLCFVFGRFAHTHQIFILLSEPTLYEIDACSVHAVLYLKMYTCIYTNVFFSLFRSL